MYAENQHVYFFMEFSAIAGKEIYHIKTYIGALIHVLTM